MELCKNKEGKTKATFERLLRSIGKPSVFMCACLYMFMLHIFPLPLFLFFGFFSLLFSFLSFD